MHFLIETGILAQLKIYDFLGNYTYFFMQHSVRHFRSFLLMLCVSVALQAVSGIIAYAQWTKTNGTEGGNASALLWHRNTLFVGMNGGGIFRSGDGGRTWTQASSGLTQNGLYPTTLVAQGSDTLWLGTYDGVFRSTDNAVSWQAVGRATFGDVQIVKIVLHGGTIFASTIPEELSTNDTTSIPSECIFRSTNNGATWQAVSTRIPKIVGERYSLCISPSVAAGTRIYALSNEDGVYMSNDNGTTWQANNTGLTGNSLRLSVSEMLADGANLYICTRDGVYRAIRAITPTTPEGTWQALGTGLRGQILTSIQKFNSSIAVGSEGGGVFTLNTASNQWSPLITNLPNFFVRSMAADNSGGISGDGLWVGTEGAGVVAYAVQPADGRRWEQTNKNLISGLVSSIFIPTIPTASNIPVFAATGGNGIMISGDGGTTWTRAGGFAVPQGPQGGSVYVNDIAQAGSRFFAATYGGVYSSSDNGMTWSAANGTGANALTTLALSVYGVGADPAGTTVYAGTGNGLFASTNNGATWQQRGMQSLDDSIQIRNFAFKRSGTTTTMFAGTLESGVYRSTDGGTTWREASGNLTRSSVDALGINALLVSGENLFAATGDGVYFSSDDGRTWARRVSGMNASNIATFRIIERNGVLIASTAGGVFRSTNGGQAWQNVSQGLKNLSNFALAADNTSVYSADDTFGDGVWRRPLVQVITSVRENTALSSEKLSLEAAPNPASEAFSLRFNLPKTSRVSVECFDVLGRKVLALPSGDRSEGPQMLTLDTQTLPDGVYVVRVLAGGLVGSIVVRVVR